MIVCDGPTGDVLFSVLYCVECVNDVMVSYEFVVVALNRSPFLRCFACQPRTLLL